MNEVSAGAIGKALGNGIQALGSYSAQAASRANGVSAAAQSAQGSFNQGSANIANGIGSSRITDQYGYNSAQASLANAMTQQWFERSMAFNSEEAQKQRDWQERMDNTKYQRAIADMHAAGLNPILAATNGINTGSVGGSAASISSPSASMASGGLMNGISASEGNYTGQMEYMGGLLGLLSAGIGGLSSAFKSFGSLGDLGQEFGKAIAQVFDTDKNETKKDIYDFFTNRNAYMQKYSDSDNAFNRYYNPKSKYYIGNRK